MKAMTSRERFLAALRCEEPDRVPVWDWVNNPALYEAAIGQAPRFFDGGLAARVNLALGLDAVWVPAGGFMSLQDPRWEWSAADAFTDEWGTCYQVEEGAWPTAFPAAHPVSVRADWERLEVPDPDATWRTGYAQAALACVRATPEADIAVVAGLRGPFSSLWMLMGLPGLAFALMEDPGLVEAMSVATADFWTAVGLQLVRTGVDALVIHDDMGSNTATLVSPRHLQERVLPHLRREVAALTGAGVPVILHSCGNINAILPDLVATGIAGLNNMQRGAKMDIRVIKERFGRRLCLIGNVDASTVMPYATPSEIEQAVVECLKAAGKGGGYILATDHSFHKGIPVASVLAFIAAGKQHGAYPLAV